ncbi:MAG TPA: phosphatase PAP2 family protein [Mucilaginibacter sp.]|jgi:membrane-associated phospholipid phosphatase
MNIGIKVVLDRIKLFFILYLLLLIAALLIKCIYSREEIYFTVNSMNSAWADYLAPYITDIGEGWTIIILSAIWALFNYRQAFLMATSYGVTAIIAQIVKHIFDAPRPKLYFKDQLSHIHFVKGVDVLSYHSFPSGHTVTAFSAAVVATYLCKNKNWGILFLLIAILVGFSRMYLSEHFFEDVTAGSVLGVLLTIFWINWLDGKKFIHTATWNRGLFLSFK